MEITPQQLREVDFREKWRGYDPDQVDDLLERVAVFLETVEARVRQSNERASRVEAKPREAEDPDTSMKRLLVLAQRTADAAIAEANEQAGRLVSEAEDQVRRVTEDAQAQLRSDISELETTRAGLQREVDSLSRTVVDERLRLRSTLVELLAMLDGVAVDAGPMETESSADAGGSAIRTDVAPSPPEPMPLEGGEHKPRAEAAAREQHEVDLRMNVDAPTSRAEEHRTAAEADPPVQDDFFADLREALADESPLGPREGNHVRTGLTAGGGVFDQDEAEGGSTIGRRWRRQKGD